MTITCSDPTPHFPTGYDLLKHFDRDGDGIIGEYDFSVAEEMMCHGEITEGELDFVYEALGSNIDSICPPPPPPPVTCNGGSPHFGTGCALIKHYDSDNDGIITTCEATDAVEDYYAGNLTMMETMFIIGAKDAGSINAKCPGCYTPPDPCAGVTCPNICLGTSLYGQVCLNGVCIPNTLIEANSPSCGYVPPDPCAGVTCPNRCSGTTLYKQKCVNGVCVDDYIIETNSPSCGYVPPPPPPAEGYIVSYDAPSSAMHGESVLIKSNIKNIGGSTGTFKIRVGGATSSTVSLSPGSSGTIGTYVTMPTTGTSVTMNLECIRIY